MYLNQTALWQVATSRNDCGDFQYELPKEIMVRRQEHVEEVRTSDGAIHKTNYIYYTHLSVKVDDKIDGNLVVDIYDMRTLGGRCRLRRCKTI